MFEIMRALPPRSVGVGKTELKYVITAVCGTIEPLEGITGYKPCGRTAIEIFNEDIRPLFASTPLR